MYDKGGRFERKVKRVLEKLNKNPSYQLWEQEYVAICKKNINSVRFEDAKNSKGRKKMQYRMNIIREEFTQWLEMYKKNNYVPYKFLIKYFK